MSPVSRVRRKTAIRAGNTGARARNTYANDIAAPLAIYGRAIQDVPLEPRARARATIEVSRRTRGRASMVARMENGDFDQRGNT